MDNTALIAIGVVGLLLLAGRRGPAAVGPESGPNLGGAPALPTGPSGAEIARDITTGVLESADNIIDSIAALAEASRGDED